MTDSLETQVTISSFLVPVLIPLLQATLVVTSFQVDPEMTNCMVKLESKLSLADLATT